MKAMKILIMGAGPTSALVAANLRKCRLPETMDVHIWEKNSSIGGRFQSFVSPHNGNGSADLGAQYLTQSLSETWSKPYFDELCDIGLLKKLDTSSFPGFRQDDTKINFVCAKGTGSIVEHYFEKAGVSSKIQFSRAINQINLLNDKQLTTSTKTGENEQFDVVISTIPVPELLLLQNIDQFTRGTELASVGYTSRFALGIFFHKPMSVSGNQPLNFVQTQSPIRYWSIENLKRAAGDCEGASKELPALVVHTSVDYGLQNMETDEEAVASYLLEELKKETELVNDSDKYSVICQKWKCSQVAKPYPNAPGYLVLNERPLFLACGDSFTHSGFEGCIKSAEKVVKYLESYFAQ